MTYYRPTQTWTLQEKDIKKCTTSMIPKKKHESNRAKTNCNPNWHTTLNITKDKNLWNLTNQNKIRIINPNPNLNHKKKAGKVPGWERNP